MIALLPYLGSALAGALAVAGFAPLELYPLVLLSLAFLCHQWFNAQTLRHAVLNGYAWGLSFFLGGVSWVYVSLHDVGGMPLPIAASLTLIFCAILALFPALAAWGVFKLKRPQTSLLTPLIVAAVWCVVESIRGHALTGFPWLAVGYSQSPASPLAGYSPVLGVYGTGFVLVWLAALLALAINVKTQRTAALVLAGVLCTGGGALRLVEWVKPLGEPIKVSLLQGNIPQTLKWNPERLPLSLDTYLQLAHSYDAKASQLVLLPETAIPLMFNEIPRSYLRDLAGGRHVLLGGVVPVLEAGKPPGYANGAILLDPNLKPGAYFKRHLVPLGEYAPPGFRWFFELARIPMADFTAGPEQQKSLLMPGQVISANICYEDLFGEELRYALPEATLLINLSNTAWFGDSFAQPQHLQIAQMRALEMGRMMLRATNTGMTAAVRPDGTVMAVLPPFKRDVLNVTAQGYQGLTPFVRFGNLPINMAALIIVLYAAWRVRRETL